MKLIYLDHAAATPLAREVQSAMEPLWSSTYGNPSSIHQNGVNAKKALHEARAGIAGELGVHADEIIFTGSATESCNLALIGTVEAWKKNHPGKVPHIIVSAIEHEAVLATARVLESRGVHVTRIPVDQDGMVNCADIEKAIKMETVVISIMYANNEVGTIQPLRDISKIIRNWKKAQRNITRDTVAVGDSLYPLFHTDACQATNYLTQSVPHLGVDLLTINAGKIYGPKGVAVLAVRREIPISPIIFGGGQEKGLRSGTENIPLIVGFAEALRIASEMRDEESMRLITLRDWLMEKLRGINGLTIHGHPSLRLPNNVNFSIENTDHEFLAIALDSRGISVSTKSACNETDAEHSHVLLAMYGENSLKPVSGIRVSLGRSTNMSDLERFASTLVEIKEKLIIPT